VCGVVQLPRQHQQPADDHMLMMTTHGAARSQARAWSGEEGQHQDGGSPVSWRSGIGEGRPMARRAAMLLEDLSEPTRRRGGAVRNPGRGAALAEQSNDVATTYWSSRQPTLRWTRGKEGFL
jgi:hypothetical protein